MGKKVIALVLVLLTVVVAGISVYGAGFTDAQLRTADALNHLGLFLGTDIGYQLERELNRLEGIVLTVRLFGSEKEAFSKSYRHPFTDIPIWEDDEANKYVGYAYAAGITKGRSEADGVFDAFGSMTDYMFITYVLRALGYRDSGNNAQFEWNNPYGLAKKIGLIDSVTPDTSFTRGDAVVIFWNALEVNDFALAHSLAKRGVFTEKELNESIEIYKYGKVTSDTVYEDTVYEDTVYETTGNNGADEPPVTGGNTGNSSGTTGTIPGKDTANTTDTTSAKDTTSTTDTTTASGNSGSGTTAQSPAAIKYEDYLAMSAEEQQAYYMSYEDSADFFAWYNDAKAEYDEKNSGIEIGPGGNIDIGEIIG